jgi:hypothetical protein
VQALGQPDRAIRILTGISLPKSFLSIFFAMLIVSMLANLHRSIPGQAMILTISSFSDPIGVPFFSSALLFF